MFTRSLREEARNRIRKNISSMNGSIKNNDTDQAERLAAEIMELTRSTLLVKLRFLEPAIMALGLERDPEITYMTDGWAVKYGFLHVLRSYRIQKELVFHDYLHMILHLLFHHPFIGERVDPLRWDLACDIAVEAVIDELDLKEAECLRSEQQRRIIDEFRAAVNVLTAEKIYRYLTEQSIDDTRLASLRDLVQADEHDLWYTHSKAKEQDESSPESDEDLSENDDGDGSGASGGQDKDKEQDASADGADNTSDNVQEEPDQPGTDSGNAEKQWSDISSRVQTDLETESRMWAEKAGSLLRNIREHTREKQDYRRFLQQFMALGEVMKINDSEFDYVYYTYGLELYGNTPLIEPLEYMDEKRVRELAIVLDTSASVDGGPVSSFLRKTLEILRDSDSFFYETDLRIILCDAKVQGNYRIRSAEDIAKLEEEISLTGFGGTDFRPAFRYIDSLIESGELTELRGVLYFTDGYGIFPEWQPPYDTAFVFVPDDRDSIDFDSLKMPPWAMRIVLEKNTNS